MTFIPPDDDDLGKPERTWQDAPLGGVGRGGGGASPPPGGDPARNLLEARVATLEADFRYVRRDLDDIRDSLKVLATLPTKRDLTTNILGAVGIGFAVMAIVIGGIIGGLSWLRRDADPPAVVATQPAPPATAAFAAPVVPSSKP